MNIQFYNGNMGWFDSITGAIGGAVGTIVNPIRETVGSVWNTGRDAVSTVYNEALKPVLLDAKDLLHNTTSNIGKIEGGLGGLFGNSWFLLIAGTVGAYVLVNVIKK